MVSIQRKLLEIQQNQSFDKLDSFKDSKVWQSMTKEEKDLFVFLLIKQGAQQLTKGENKILDNFSLAVEVSDQSPEVFNQQGIIFANYPENSKCLQLANGAFSQAVQKSPEFFSAWYNWASTLVAQGTLQNDFTYFIEANQKYEKALQLWDPSQEIGQEMIHWKWGLSYTLLGLHSGEPIDLSEAIKHFKLAVELGCEDYEFYIDYGHALALLSGYLEKEELLIEAAKLFFHSTQLAPDNFESWFNLGSCMLRLCEVVPHDDFFEQGMKSFAKAIQIEPTNSTVWLRWALVEAGYGKFKRDPTFIESSLQKFAKSDEIEPEQPDTLRFWAEMELFLGSHFDDLKYIHSAKQKIIKSLESHPDSAEGWYIYGTILNEFGRYFEDESYYLQAMEKLHYGLTLSNRHPLLFYGLALSNFALGELKDDITFIEKSNRYCSQVIEIGGHGFPQFWNDWGVALLRMGEMTNQISDVESAIEKFEKALKQVSEIDSSEIDLEWVYNYGCAFDLLGELKEDSQLIEKAVNTLTQVVQLNPNYLYARYNLALALSHLGEFTSDVEPYFRAIEHFQKLVELEPEHESVHMDFAVSLIHLALLIQDDHLPERADALFQQAEQHLILSASLGNLEAYYYLACLYSLTGHYALAMNYIQRCRDMGTLPLPHELRHDEWLENLNQISEFKEFLEELLRQQFKEE